jgi:hypothetical protein
MMTENTEANEAATKAMRGEELLMPDESRTAKLPMPSLSLGGNVILPQELQAAWTQYMVSGFKQNEQMFRSTLEAFMKPYRLTVWLYATLFGVGVGLFLIAVLIGLRNGNSIVAIAFAGLSVTAFLAFFVRQPLQALEENLEFITWLGVAFNTYWTRLMYITDPKTVHVELKSAEEDFRMSVERLIAQHAGLRGKRPGGGEHSEKLR